MGPTRPPPGMLDRTGTLEHAANVAHAGPATYGSLVQRVYGSIGIAVGFVLGVVPGVLMRRRYTAWRTGYAPTPGIAGPLGAATLWGGAGALLWWGAGLEIPAVMVRAVGGLPSLVVASRG